MEFNPLDLLASAAELQQRNDDSPNIMTRQKIAAAVPANKIITISSVPKENRNGNKSDKSNGVIVVKKLKIGANSDLEKMLDEHNYGNAKKAIKFVKNLTTVSSDGSVSGVIGSISAGREPEQEPVESSGNETSERSEVKQNVNNLKIESTPESCSHSDTLKSVQSGKKETSDKDSSLPEVEKENNGLISTSLGPYSSDQSITADKGDKQGHSLDKSHIVHDNITAQTDKTVSNGLDGQMSNDSNDKTTSNTIHFVKTTESMNSGSCLQKAGIESNDKTKKVIVKVSPENNIFIEKKSSEDKKLPIEGSSHIKGTNLSSDKLEIAINPQKASTGEKSEPPIHQPSILLKDFNDIKSVTVIRSLLTSDNDKSRSVKPAKLHSGSLRVNCDTESYLRVLEDKMDTCDSPRSRLDLDPFCNSSSNGIHLLSPDRRNPDSVGVVESPVISAYTDSSNSCETETETEKTENVLSPEMVSDTSKVTVMCDEASDNIEIPTEQTENESEKREKQKEVNKTPVLSEGKQKIIISVKEPKPEQASSSSETVTGDEKVNNMFRFDSDHCYAGLPGRVNSVNPRELPSDEETDTDEEEEGSSPDASPTELSQDSGYGDITQSPDNAKKDDTIVKPNPEKLVPVLISFNKSGALTVHTDKGVSKELPKQIFTLAENNTLDSNANLLNTDKGKNLNKPATVTSNVRPLLLSPIGKGTASVLIDPSKISLVDPKTVPNIVSPPVRTSLTQQVSPPKFGKFRIGSFASFSNAGIDMDSPVKEKAKVERTPKTSPFSRSASHPHSLSSLRSSGDRSLLRHLDSHKRGSSSLSLSPPVPGYANHIQHDHDYCLHSVMPSTIDSAKENTQRETVHKTKSTHVKPKKYESELQKELLKNDKPKKKGKGVRNIVEKDDSYDELELMLDEERYRDLPTYAESVRSKSRSERYIDHKSAEPKMKIAGSTSFQDQFVYFMSTKKRSRRRESRDSHTPFQVPFDKIILPPHKPGDIVVPHLTDADIENLKLFNKQNKHSATATHSQRSDSFSLKSNLPNSRSTNSENNVDEESKIINTILSLENESLTEEQIPYSENMEMYGQSDIMNLLPDQMNLTQEQMDLLFSAVDEVQNSSPNLVADKLATPTGDSVFGQFPTTEPGYTDTDEKHVSDSGDKATTSTDKIAMKNDTDVSPSAETPAIPTVEPSVVEVVADEQVSSDTPSSNDLDSADKNTGLSNCDSDNSMVTNSETNSNILCKTPAALSEVINDTVTTGTFTSLNQNSDSETVENNLGQVGNNSTSVFSNLTNSVNPDLPLPTLDRSSLDLLSSDYKIDRSDLFPDPAVHHTPQSIPTSLPAPTPSHYNAPWIVTVSMYWNDLPAIMINNLPYVRLVDIHKQILPAKDTGILKKRCQLMGIEVENCTEMQRYFLVQYGKAINSKSTLIVSKDAAKELIGYYVEPQPTKPGAEKQHKSIIEHRREQLRRIALAKRAALRAEKLKKEKAGHNLLKPVDGDDTETTLGATDAPRQRSQSLSSRLPFTLSPGSKTQRSTRHKKINFLELLRGDSATSLPDNESTSNDGNNKKKRLAGEGVPSVKAGTKRKRYSGSGDRNKVKVVKYVESESSESTSDSDMDYTDDSSDSSESEKVVIVKKPKRKRTSLFNHKPRKRKYKKNVVLKKNIVKVPSFKVKFKQAKTGSKEMVKPGKDASISRVHIVKMSSEYEKPLGKQSVKKKVAVSKSIPVKSKTAVSESNKSELKSDTIAEEKAPCSNESMEEKPDILENEKCHVKESDTDADTELDNYLNGVKENSRKSDTVQNVKSEENNTGDKTTISQEVVDEIATKTPALIDKKESNVSEVQDKEIKAPLKETEQITKGLEMETIDTDSELKDTAYHESDDLDNSVEETSEKADTLDKYVLAMIGGGKDKNSEVNVSESSFKREIVSDKISSVQLDTGGVQMETDGQIPQKCDKETSVLKADNALVLSHSCDELPAEASSNAIVKNESCPRTDILHSGKTDNLSRLVSPTSSDSNLSEASCSRAASRCSENSESTGVNVNFYLLNKDADVVEETPPVRIVHKDSTPQNNGVRVRRQLGEAFVEHYNNKRSFCIRCYTCRKMMSVDHFTRHLHDVSGGLVSTDIPQIIEPCDSDMTDSEIKSWEVFQRKKELFENNQLPSDVSKPSIVCNVDSDSNHSFTEKQVEEPSRGPIIKHTPVSPVKRDKVNVVTRPKTEESTRKKVPALLQPKHNKLLEKSKSWGPKENSKESKDGVRASSRKRKASHLLSSDEYTFYKKLPRLQNE